MLDVVAQAEAIADLLVAHDRFAKAIDEAIRGVCG